MRRLLLPAALVVAAVAALAVLRSSWSERDERAGRAARSRVDLPARGGSGDRGAGSEESTRQDGSADAPQSRVRGTVTGPMGVLWGARVVAFRAGSGEILAETHTNPDGGYTMDLEPEVPHDLAVEPSDLTGLLPWRREAVTVRPGEDLTVDAALAAGAVVRGRFIDENGEPAAGIVVRVVAEDPARPGSSSPASRAAALAKSNREGRFLLRGLQPARYVLDVLDPSWMFPKPVSVLADGRDVDLVVVPCFQIELVVKDIETGDPVPAFTVRATSGDLVLLEAAGRDGEFSTRIRWPGQLPPGERLQAARRTFLDVAAPGFQPRIPLSGGPDRVAWMVPIREQNTTIHVLFDNGDPYFGELLVNIRSQASGAACAVRFVRDPGTGAFRGALPWGDWEVGIIPLGAYRTGGYTAEARTGPGLEASIPLTLPGGGTIVFTPPAGVDRTTAYLCLIQEEREDLGEGTSVRVARVERTFAVSREGTRVQGIPPGTYDIGVPRSVEIVPGQFVTMAAWVRRITIDARSVEEIRLPE
ncbi:MAG: carboxypeptidase-like regulatory domain-containing protein [Planctomycetes bacterium]|nr:carboxypeptidase-like regulatory domain-containing protein [Planctomycetota bacterium]